MSTHRPWTALALLCLFAVVAVQPAAAATAGYYSEPGRCGGTSPVTAACTSQNKDVPAGTTTYSAYVALGHYCVTTPCELGTVRIDYQITGFRPTSYDPAFLATGHCDFSDSGVGCYRDSTWGSLYNGDDVIIAGQISKEVCAVVCASPPPVADWCVAVRFNGSGSCPLENPILGEVLQASSPELAL
jgi:hypothetical protein